MSSRGIASWANLSAWNVFRLTHPPIPELLVSFRMLQRIEFFFLEREKERNKQRVEEGRQEASYSSSHNGKSNGATYTCHIPILLTLKEMNTGPSQSAVKTVYCVYKISLTVHSKDWEFYTTYITDYTVITDEPDDQRHFQWKVPCQVTARQVLLSASQRSDHTYCLSLHEAGLRL